MKEEIINKYGKEAYFVGVDLGFRLKWWQKILVWIGFKNKWQDRSCSTVFKQKTDGTLEVVDVNYF